MKTFCISKEYSETLGARYISDGDFSGEHFRNTHLIPLFNEAHANGEELLINLDGGYGNPVSFVEEAFGGLARIYGTQRVIETLRFVSHDAPNLPAEINEYICNPHTNKVYLHAKHRNEHHG